MWDMTDIIEYETLFSNPEGMKYSDLGLRERVLSDRIVISHIIARFTFAFFADDRQRLSRTNKTTPRTRFEQPVSALSSSLAAKTRIKGTQHTRQNFLNWK